MNSKIYLLAITVFVFYLVLGSFTVNAAATDNVTGWAWSENIGWISFNCTNQNVCGTSNYGVSVDTGTGLFSKYAWSDNIGWITFNSAELVGCPSGTCEAKLNISSCSGGECPITGWARACAVFQSGCSGALNTTGNGGWDGWIKLSGATYGLKFNQASEEVVNWAWGGDDTDGEANVGWVSFNCLNQGVCGTSNYKVKISGVASAFGPVNLTIAPFNNTMCGYVTNPRVRFKWDDNPDGVQVGYDIQVDNNSDFSSPTIATGLVVSTVDAYTNSNSLSWGTTYYWRLRLWNGTAYSSWVSGPQLITPVHYYPLVQFKCSISSTGPWQDCSTLSVFRDQIVYFKDETQFFTASGNSWWWDFATGTPSTVQNPNQSFSPGGKYNITLVATDGDGNVCFLIKELTVKASGPGPIEQMRVESEPKTFSFFNAFAASLSKVFSLLSFR